MVTLTAMARGKMDFLVAQLADDDEGPTKAVSAKEAEYRGHKLTAQDAIMLLYNPLRQVEATANKVPKRSTYDSDIIS